MPPLSLFKKIRRHIAHRRMAKLSKLPIDQAFDHIYEHGIWANGRDEPSGGGSYGRAAEDYITFVVDYVRENGIRTIVDIGCGDFNVGARIAPHVERYHALDVSARIIELNRARYATLKNVEFRQLNACTEPLVSADLVTVRQVLQHLSNAQIESVLRNIERTRFTVALIAEQVSNPSPGFQPNRDLPGHSSGTRVVLDSGVVLTAPPFSRDARVVTSISLGEGDAGHRQPSDALAVYEWRPAARGQ